MTPATPFFVARFNNSSGIDKALATYTSDSGATFTTQTGNFVITTDGRVRNNQSAGQSNGYWSSSGNLSTGGIAASWDLEVKSQTNGEIFNVVIGGTGSNIYGGGYAVSYTMGQTAFKILRYDTAAATTTYNIGGGSGQVLAPGTYHFEFLVTATSQTLIFNGSPQNPVGTNSGVSVAKGIGLDTYIGTGSDTDSTGMSISNLVVYDTATRNVQPVDSAGVVLSPGNQYVVPATSSTWIHNRTSAKFDFTGTSLAVAIDTSLFTSGSLPAIIASIDGSPWIRQNLSSGQTILPVFAGPIFGEASTGTHTAEIALDVVGASETDPWTPVDAIKIDGWIIDYGIDSTTGLLNSLKAPTGNATARPKRAMIFGDSITRGWASPLMLTVGDPYAVNVFNTSAGIFSLQNFASILAHGINAEMGIVAYSGQGWTTHPTGNVPVFPSTFGYYFSGQPRVLPALDYLFVCHGTNDNGATTASNLESVVSAFLATARAAVQTSTWIFICAPAVTNLKTSDGVTIPAALSAAVTAYQASSGDSRVACLDPSVRHYGSYTPSNPASQYLPNGDQHLGTEGHALLGADLTALATAVIAASSGGVGSVTNSGSFATGGSPQTTGAGVFAE